MERSFYGWKYGKNMFAFDVQAVICRKRSAFEMQFHITEVSMFSKTCVKNHEYLSSIARQKDLNSMYRDALVSGFVNILVYFNTYF